MDWAKNIFVRNAALYEQVLEGMWPRGEEDAIAIAAYLKENGLDKCKILDIPSGIGRIGIPLARLGFEVCGVDISTHLLRTAGAKARKFNVQNRISFVKADMHNIESKFAPASFDAAINVFTSIGYGSEADDLVFFHEVHGIIKKGGFLLISGLRNRDYILRNPSQNIYEENDQLLVLNTYRFDTEKSREEGSWKFYKRMGNTLRFAGEFPISVRVYSPHELVSRLAATGWEVVDTYESFVNRGPFRPDSPVYAVAAQAV